MSTSSISSAPCSTSSGRRSLTGAPVIVATASATLSRCCTFIVLTTWMPASRMTSTSSQRLVRAEPGTFVCASSSIEGDRGMPGDHGVGVHLLDDHAPVLDPAARHDLEAVEQLRCVRPAMRLDEADDEVGATTHAPVALLEHPVGLADAGGHAEVDAEPPALARGLGPNARQHLVCRGADIECVALGIGHCRRPSMSRFTSRTLTRGFPRKPRVGSSVCRRTASRTASSEIPRASATRATW